MARNRLHGNRSRDHRPTDKLPFSLDCVHLPPGIWAVMSFGQTTAKAVREIKQVLDCVHLDATNSRSQLVSRIHDRSASEKEGPCLEWSPMWNLFATICMCPLSHKICMDLP
jgi:hypothetical protein